MVSNKPVRLSSQFFFLVTAKSWNRCKNAFGKAHLLFCLLINVFFLTQEFFLTSIFRFYKCIIAAFKVSFKSFRKGSNQPLPLKTLNIACYFGPADCLIFSIQNVDSSSRESFLRRFSPNPIRWPETQYPDLLSVM